MTRTLKDDILEGGLANHFYYDPNNPNIVFSITDIYLHSEEQIDGIDIIESRHIRAKVKYYNSKGKLMGYGIGNKSIFLGGYLDSKRIQKNRKPKEE